MHKNEVNLANDETSPLDTSPNALEPSNAGLVEDNYKDEPPWFKRLFTRFKAFTESLQKRPKTLLILLSVFLLILLVAYLFYGLLADVFDYRATGDEFYLNILRFSLENRYPTIFAIIIVAVCVGYSTVIFQTVTGARILTPGVLGFENVYMFIQTALVFLMASQFVGVVYVLEGNANYAFSVVLMVIFSLLVFLPLLTRGSKGVFILLLVGIILSTLFASLTSYMMLLIDPNDFDIIQGRMFASFTNPNLSVMIGATVAAVLAILFTPSTRVLDVLSLGRENAIGLGINHKIVVLRILVIVSILVAVSTVLVGPIMFLGLLAANLAYQLIKNFRHKYTIPAAILVAAIFVALGQFLIYHIVTMQMQLPVIINLVGGVYFIFLLLRERKKSA
ncbi:MAG: iron chelate uptake ABC transporter family permease subunit [Firmicutes bacterium]|nr:iron chelate uptake ABC transporter family permease subunit [Bacillota bacterium]